VPHREQFGPIDVEGLIELPTAERAGLVFAVLTPGAPMDIDEWLGDMGDALPYLELDKVYRHETTTVLESGNWKSTADGYLDGYHIGYPHSSNLGLKQVNNRNTCGLYGPHVRLGFANKAIVDMKDRPVEQWDLTEAMSLVHYLFPDVSISGQPGRATMMSG
jgi:phenylpropionate dioxygenase-like ring-hydroxylating dioxygenase large terminal subunit